MAISLHCEHQEGEISLLNEYTHPVLTLCQNTCLHTYTARGMILYDEELTNYEDNFYER